MNLLVSPNGHLWDVANGALHKYLGYWGDTASLVTMATGALGFVAVGVADGRVRIRLRPDMFSASSFKMVVGILVHRNPSRIVIDIDDVRTVPQVFGSVEDAVACLSELCEEPVRPQQRAAFFTETMDIGRIRMPRREALQQHFQQWRRRGGRLDLKTMRDMQRNPFAIGQLFARIDGQKVIPESWPRYMKLYKREDAIKIIGKPFIEHNDGGHMHAASRSYLATDKAGEPRLELAEATIDPPNGPPRHLRYERLLLPWRSPGGDHFVSTISFVRSKTLTLHRPN